MKIDWNNTHQFAKLIDKKIFYPFYNSVHHFAEIYPTVTSYAGPVIGVMNGTVRTIQAIGDFTEAVIKGGTNICSSLNSQDEVQFKRGGAQLLQANRIRFSSPMKIFYEVVIISRGMFYYPKETSAIQAANYQMNILIAQENSSKK